MIIGSSAIGALAEGVNVDYPLVNLHEEGRDRYFPTAPVKGDSGDNPLSAAFARSVSIVRGLGSIATTVASGDSVATESE